MSGRQLQRLWRIYLRRRSVLFGVSAVLVIFALLLVNLATTVDNITREESGVYSSAYNASKRHVRSVFSSSSLYNNSSASDRKAAFDDTEDSALYIVTNADGAFVYPTRSSSGGPAASGPAFPYGSVLVGDSLASRGEGEKEASQWLRVLFPVSGFLELYNARNTMQVVPLRLKPSAPAATSAAAVGGQTAGSSSNNDLGKMSAALLPFLKVSCRQELFQQDVDLNGGDLPGEEPSPYGPGPNPVSAQSAIACCTLCVLHSAQCDRWTFVASDGLCYLKGSAARAVPGRKGLVSSSVGGAGTVVAAREQYLTTKSYLHSVASADVVAPSAAASLPVCCSRPIGAEGVMSAAISGGNSSEAVAAAEVTPDSFWSAVTDVASTYSLRVERTHEGWTQQWPIGSGRMGALVGGTVDGEVVPVSIAGLFVRHAPAAAKDSATPKGARISKDTALDAFRDTRRLLAAGSVGAAHARAKAMLAGASGQQLGMFQYAADVSFVYSSSPLSPHANPKTAAHEVSAPRKKGSKERVAPPRKAPAAGAAPVPGGRRALLAALRGLFNISPAEASANDLSSGILDTKNGIAHSYFIDRDASNRSLFKVQHREWFASSADGHVVSARVSCRTDKSTAAGCVNLAMQLSREGSHPLPKTEITFNEVPTSRTHRLDKNAKMERRAEDRSGKVYTLSMTMEASTTAVHVPTVHVCGIAVCRSTKSQLAPTPWGGAGSRAIVCNDADSFELLLSADIADTASPLGLGSSGGGGCWERVSRAYALGRDSLRRRHVAKFAAAMLRAELSLLSGNAEQACPAAPLQQRLKAVNNGCSSASSGSGSESNRVEGTDVRLIAQAFQYGRYLLLSAGSDSAMNLQGLWADGSAAAWNGDYHLNINMQMAYWAAHAVGLSETTAPLHAFIRSLALAGRSTATELYGCSSPGAWVAHGFTDSALATGLLGEAQWALCVTCGAWLATHLFDSLSYSFDRELLAQSLPVLRGAARFFLDHMWTDRLGVRHTGPTTSPENSYCVKGGSSSAHLANSSAAAAAAMSTTAFPHLLKPPPGKPKPQPRPPAPQIGYLSLSPSIDESVLRQLANGYRLLLDWQRAAGEGDDAAAREDDVLHTRLVEAIRAMPGGGMPQLDAQGRAREYPPRPFPHADPATTTVAASAATVTVAVAPAGSEPAASGMCVESPDPAHRHFSPLHWLYPNPFAPSDEALFAGGSKLLQQKVAAGGGHTSWSAAWEASLWSRLQQPERALAALTRMLRRYTAQNLLSLHPPLDPSGPEECSTCYGESQEGRQRSGADASPSGTRGLVTEDGFKFQLDGNLGFLAAVTEMLLQSHIPRYLLLLPALPTALAGGGSFKGLRARGDVDVSVRWLSGRVTSATIVFRSTHPWLRGQNRLFAADGFVTAAATGGPILLAVASPNALRIDAKASDTDCVATVSADRFASGGGAASLNATEAKARALVGMRRVLFELTSFPCRVALICA